MNKFGIIKWFDNVKGFGVIETLLDGEYFIHQSNFLAKPTIVQKKTPVIFQSKIEKGKKNAKKCHIPTTIEDFKTLYFLKVDPIDSLKANWTITKKNRIVYDAVTLFSNGKTEGELIDAIKQVYLDLKDYELYDFPTLFRLFSFFSL